jgi:hypothetical protein
MKARTTTTASTTPDAASPALISSDRVNGTDVYGVQREKIGSIDHMMIDKRSGVVAYAVMSFGGFLGLGEDHYPIPWKQLRYDESLDGYITELDESRIKSAPTPPANWSSDRKWETNLHDHYMVDYYWMRTPMI